MEILPDPLDLTACAPAQAMCQDIRDQAAEQPTEREARHRAALEAMVERHARFVYRVAFAVVRNAADAEDVVQETFLQLLRGAPGRTIGDERGYLARVAWRLGARRRQRRPAHGGIMERPEELLRELPAAGQSPEQAALHGDLEAWLHRRIDELPDQLRQPLALAALGELSSPEIAGILGIPEGTVRRRIHTARQILRRQMEERKGGSA